MYVQIFLISVFLMPVLPCPLGARCTDGEDGATWKSVDIAFEQARVLGGDHVKFAHQNFAAGAAPAAPAAPADIQILRQPLRRLQYYCRSCRSCKGMENLILFLFYFLKPSLSARLQPVQILSGQTKERR